MMRATGVHIDIFSNWEKQRLTNPIPKQLGEIAEEVNERLNNPPKALRLMLVNGLRNNSAGIRLKNNPFL